MKKIIFNIQTDASGDDVIDARVVEKGFLHRVDVLGSGLDAGTDWTLKEIDLSSGIATRTLLTLTDENGDIVIRPRGLEQGPTGADLTSSDKYYIDGKLQLTIAQGGNTLSGRMIVYIE